MCLFTQTCNEGTVPARLLWFWLFACDLFVLSHWAVLVLYEVHTHIKKTLTRLGAHTLKLMNTNLAIYAPNLIKLGAQALLTKTKTEQTSARRHPAQPPSHECIPLISLPLNPRTNNKA